MKTKYNWINVPTWVMVQVTEDDGTIVGWDTKPTCSPHWGVWAAGGESIVLGKGDAKDWQNSLEMRPSLYVEKDVIEKTIKNVLERFELGNDSAKIAKACAQEVFNKIFS